MKQITKEEFNTLVFNKKYSVKTITLGNATYTNYYNKHYTKTARDGHVVAAIRSSKLEGIKYFSNK